MPSFQLQDLAERFNLSLQGDGDACVDGVATLADARPQSISFLSNKAYLGDLQCSRAGAVILTAEHAERFDGNRLISDNPYADYARVAALFQTPNLALDGIHSSAVIDPSAELGDGVTIGPQASIGANCRIGDGCHIGAGTHIGHNSILGPQCRIDANVTIAHGVQLGSRVILHSGVVIGADGFGLALDGDHWIKVPQLGGVRIGDDCEVGANSTIDRGAIEDTVLEEDVRIDNQVQIAHNVHIGAHTAIAGCVGIAGSARIGKYCMLAGGSGVGGHLEICDGVTLLARGMITRSITEPGQYGSGLEAQPVAEWRRNHARLRSLDKTLKRLLRLDKNTTASDPQREKPHDK